MRIQCSIRVQLICPWLLQTPFSSTFPSCRPNIHLGICLAFRTSAPSLYRPWLATSLRRAPGGWAPSLQSNFCSSEMAFRWYLVHSCQDSGSQHTQKLRRDRT
ncbi:hypothetical protein HBI56_015380 [Parastagonospora nodorum]|uniref:Uncharacterized protein n=1 Tax=Phaeosphaeria nodorum (strain SN15 / ATCC MYA-4574 / FGSC 10173) TaxID=321614 RepID=A0A7U2F5D3_PHANO|nr:hypothetical protein HBH56_084620 [Parastagonospora nodorum]QRC96829.1 hypothetical protein JI435_409660 [Parastagonospora nodorum SN15]KAH3930003.1 hypothetical protein HBH54_117220 [Parastagonospora nodorum]KAH3977055.1 hypothetical protein HBH51_074160 [Parastagonospora nodorum]KAH3982369.1 hypothetical protein HBH52_080320 [Parastagonospora nodorum]